VRQITSIELVELLENNPDSTLLLDVREPHEFAHCHIAGSQLIPMQTIPNRLAELPRDRTIVTICHHGMRSQQVANFLIQQGINNVINLSGGVDAWALSVEPDMPRY
jgi:rhodanese-related sulfurtransferase